MTDINAILSGLDRLEIELPSWGFADTGTRFGKYLQDAAAITLEDKLTMHGRHGVPIGRH